MRKLGIALCVLAALFLIGLLSKFSIVGLILCAVCAFFGIRLVKQNPAPEKPAKKAAAPAPAPAPAAPVRKEEFKVAGTSFRQEAFEQLGLENDDYSLSKKAALDNDLEDEKIYEYDFMPSNVELVPDPGNEYDENAIKVIVDGEHIGFVPKEKTAHIKELLDTDGIKWITADIYGGKFKIITEDEEGKYRTDTGESNYGCRVTIGLKG